MWTRRGLLGLLINGLVSGRLLAAHYNPSWSGSPNGTRNVVGPTVDFVANFGGVPGDVTDNAGALVSFRTYGTGQSLPFTMTVPAGTFRVSTNSGQFFGRGVRAYTMSGAGQTQSIFNVIMPSASPLFVAGLGQVDNPANYARIGVDANAGDSQITLQTPSDASKMPIGSLLLITCCAIQGSFNKNYGFPTNAQFFDYVTVTSSNPTTGVVQFTPPLTENYKTTYPFVQAAQGGPAYVYVLHSSWDTTVTIEDVWFKYNVNDIATYSTGRTITHRRVSWSGDIKGPAPSQNYSISYLNCDCTSNVIEVDKFIVNLTFDGCTISNQLWMQSTCVKNYVVSNNTINFLNGTARNSTITNNTITTCRLGPQAHGCGESVVLSGNAITTFQASTYTDTLADKNYTMSGGVIRSVRTLAVTGCADNGSGKVRLTVGSTADLITGMTLAAQAMFVTDAQNIPYTLTVVDATHVDLAALNFASVTWTGSGNLVAEAMRWAVPGRWVNMLGASGVYGNFQVIDIYEDANYVYASTSLAGGWPSGVTGVSPHPCENLSGTGNTGCPEALELSMTGAHNKPVYSYVNRTYDKTLGTSGAPQPVSWGLMTATDAMSVDVQTPYTGVQGTLYFRPTQFPNQVRVLRGGSVVTMDMRINVKAAGKRTYNGVTNTWGGAIDGADILPAFQAGDWLIGVFVSGPTLSANVSGESAGPVLVYEIKSDQGI